MTPLADLRRRQLVVVSGKGGVGKTAIAATLGRALAAAGRRALVLEVDPRESVHQMFDLPPSGGRIVPVEPRLWVQNLKPVEVLDEVVREQVKIELLVRRVLDSPVYQHFAPAAPGLKELAVLGHALRLLRRLGARPAGRGTDGAPSVDLDTARTPSRRGGPGPPEIDTVVLDAPATGHGVLLLTAPLLVAEVIKSGPFGRMAADVRGLVASPERCGIVVVSQAEEMPVEEALELRAALVEGLGRAPELLVVNGLYPPFPGGAGAPAVAAAVAASTGAGAALDPPSAAVAAAPAGGDPVTDLWRRRRDLNERQLARLAAAWEGPRVELPLLPLERGPRLVAELLARLTRAAMSGEAPAAARGGAEGRRWS